MGCSDSKHFLPIPALPSDDYSCIAPFGKSGYLLMYLGETEHTAIKNIIHTYWPKGIKEQGCLCTGTSACISSRFNCLHVELCDYICAQEGREKEVCRPMWSSIIATMGDMGWDVILVSKVSRKELASVFFKRQTLDGIPCPHPSIGMSLRNRLQVDGFPEDLERIIRDAVAQMSSGIKKEKKRELKYEIKLKGSPFQGYQPGANNLERISAQLLMMKIFQDLQDNQYELSWNGNILGVFDTFFLKYNASLSKQVNLFFMELIGNIIRVVKAPESVFDIIRDLILQCYPEGIKVVKKEDTWFELKLKDNHFFSTGQKGIDARIFFLRLMENLSSIGWLVETSFDMAGYVGVKNTIIFKQSEPKIRSMMCVAPLGQNEIVLIGAPNIVVEASRSLIEQVPRGCGKKCNNYQRVSYYADLAGSPWEKCHVKDGIYARTLLLGLLFVIEKLDWRVVFSGDISTSRIRSKIPFDVHTLWFMHTPSDLIHRTDNVTEPID